MSIPTTRPLAIALWLCAISDLAAVPLLMGTDDVPAALGVVVAVLGLLTGAAAVGVGRGAAWARPIAWATRAVDLTLALPGVVAGGAATAAAGVTVGLSVVAIVLLVRTRSVEVPA